MRVLTGLAGAALIAVTAGCTNLSPPERSTVTGAGLGAGAGAAIGALTGGDAGTGAVIGGALGAGAGYLKGRREEGTC